MGFIKDFIQRKEKEIINQSNSAVKTLNKDWDNFQKEDKYLIYDDKFNYFQLIKKGNKETKVPWYLFWDLKFKSNLKSNLEQLEKYMGLLSVYNQNFVIQKKMEYKNLFKKGNLTLDNDQQTAIITDDKYNLVVAGAGSGKTEVLITRIAYLIKRKSDTIKPKRILALAFQNKAANEIKGRLKKRYGVDVEVRTFHSLGKNIIQDISKKKGVKPPKRYVSIRNKECSNNNIERFHGTFRQRDKVMKGFEGNQKQFAENFQTYYNFVKNHMTLDTTPAQKAGINQKPEWKDLLLKAIQQ